MSVELKEEIARYRELLRRDPQSRVFAPLAEARRREGCLEEALALARAGVANHPAYAGGRLTLGRVLLDMGRVREAVEELGRAIAAAPGGASAWRVLGEARARLRDRSGAFEAFARALALDPLDDVARRAVLDIDSLIASLPAPEAPPEVPSEARADSENAVPPEVPSEARADSHNAARADSHNAARADSDESPSSEAGAEALDPRLEVIGDAAPPTPSATLSGLESAWLEDRELSLLLIPERSPGEGGGEDRFPEVREDDAATFLAGRLDILDIVHSSLAPEAMEQPPEALPQVPSAARADLVDVVPSAARADSASAVTAAKTSWEFQDDDAGEAPGAETESGEPEADEAPALPSDLRTETLADLYVQQGHVERARSIYRAILAENPLHLRVKKKLLELPAPDPAAGENTADQKVAALGRWLDRARSTADRSPPRAGARGKRMGDSAEIVTPPTEEGR